MILLSKASITLIKAYQRIWHPIYQGISDKMGWDSICKFNPSCSQYAIACFYKYSFLLALRKTVCRIKRCDKNTVGGFDPP